MPTTLITADPRILPSARWPDSLPWWQRRLTHALVIGGTGMLRAVALSLASTADTVTVLARTPARLRALARESRSLRKPAALNPIPVDYSSTEDFARVLREVANDFGPVTLCVAWIHSTAPDALPAAARALAAAGPLRLFHIVGSTQDRPVPTNAAPARELPGVQYRRITLGFVPDPAAGDSGGGPSRWLTDDEITTGILRAIELDTPDTTIGATTPWSARPT